MKTFRVTAREVGQGGVENERPRNVHAYPRPLVQFSLFRRDKDYPVRGTGTVNSGGSGIFQYLNALYVARVDLA